MKYYYLISVLFFLFSCKETIATDEYTEISVAHLSGNNMEILPEMPSALDNIKLVIFEDCKYNKLNKVERDGNTINIEKQFNSMIMAPCVLTNDTIVIGKLPMGTYRINYKLVDLSTQTSAKSTLAVFFKLVVNK